MEGVLGTTGEGVKDAQDAAAKYLKNTREGRRKKGERRRERKGKGRRKGKRE